MAKSHHNRGLLLKDTGRMNEAEQHFDRALSIQTQLAADFLTRPDFRQELAKSHNNRGILLKDTGRPKEADQHFEQALSILTQLATDFPTAPTRQELACEPPLPGYSAECHRPAEEAEWHYDQA
ncbi:MAG: tetratricopeptide repeat protein [Gemmataceae bacterium]